MDIWIVEQSSGSWDDFTTWNVIAFSCKSAAESWVEENNATLPAQKEKKKEEAKEFDSRYEALLEKYDLAEWDDLNPNFRKWREELDKLTTEWTEKDMAIEYTDLNNFYINHEIKLIS